MIRQQNLTISATISLSRSYGAGELRGAGERREFESSWGFCLILWTLLSLCLIFLRNFQQEPSALFRLIGPVIQQPIRSIVAGFPSQFFGFPELCHEF